MERERERGIEGLKKREAASTNTETIPERAKLAGRGNSRVFVLQMMH